MRTTTVFSIASETTRPVRTFLLPRSPSPTLLRLLVGDGFRAGRRFLLDDVLLGEVRERGPLQLAALDRLPPLLQRDAVRLRHGDRELALGLAGAKHREDARDVVADLLDPHGVVELTGRALEAEVEELLLLCLQSREQLVVGELAKLGRLHSCTPVRMMNFERIGSLCAARLMASRAVSSATPDSSNMTRPGLTTATHPSGLPLPEPMRVSAGFFVTGLSGKMLIQTFPPRRMWRVIATRAASIWRLVTQPGVSASRP